jgi:hypothetical protein
LKEDEIFVGGCGCSGGRYCEWFGAAKRQRLQGQAFASRKDGETDCDDRGQNASFGNVFECQLQRLADSRESEQKDGRVSTGWNEGKSGRSKAR